MKRASEWQEIHDRRLAAARHALSNAKKQYERMYEDYMNGRLPEWLYEQKAAALSEEITELTAEIAEIEAEIPVDMDRLGRTLELAQMVSTSYSMLTYAGKRKLVRALLSNCSWKDGQLEATLRHPFDMIADATAMIHAGDSSEATENAVLEIWRSGRDSNPQLPP